MDKETERLAEGPAALKRSRQKGPKRRTGTSVTDHGFQTHRTAIARQSRLPWNGTSSAKRMRGLFSSTVARPGSIAGRSCPSECRRTNKLLHVDTKSARRRQYPTPVN